MSNNQQFRFFIDRLAEMVESLQNLVEEETRTGKLKKEDFNEIIAARLRAVSYKKEDGDLETQFPYTIPTTKDRVSRVFSEISKGFNISDRNEPFVSKNPWAMSYYRAFCLLLDEKNWKKRWLHLIYRPEDTACGWFLSKVDNGEIIGWHESYQMELKSTHVSCMTMNLKWVHDNLDELIQNAGKNGGTNKNTPDSKQFRFMLMAPTIDISHRLDDIKSRTEQSSVSHQFHFRRLYRNDKYLSDDGLPVPIVNDLVVYHGIEHPFDPHTKFVMVTSITPLDSNLKKHDGYDTIIPAEQAKQIYSWFKRTWDECKI